MWQLRCIATWGRPTPRQSLSALITTPMPRLKSLNISVTPSCRVFTADMLCYTVTLISDLWPWMFVVYRLCRGQTLYQIWAQSSNPWRSYCDCNVWRNDFEQTSRVALGSGIIFTTFEFGQLPICAWLIAVFAADTLCHAVTLTFDPVTLKVCDTSCVAWS